jgi:hypothetical protein
MGNPSINNFINSFTTDVARPNRFDVNIVVPAMLQNYSPVLRNLSLRCESTELPGRTFGTVDQKFGSNPTSKFPMHSSYNDLTMTFIVSAEMTERTFFDVWMEYINPTTSFDFDYKQNFASTITISQYDLQNVLTYSVNLFKAYPIAINQMDLDWSNDGYHKLSVVFAYDYWQNSGIDLLYESLPQTQNQSNFGLTSFEGSAAQQSFFTNGQIVPAPAPSVSSLPVTNTNGNVETNNGFVLNPNF